MVSIFELRAYNPFEYRFDYTILRRVSVFASYVEGKQLPVRREFSVRCALNVAILMSRFCCHHGIITSRFGELS